MNYILFDGPSRNNLLPFTFTRPVADIRIGILTVREKWEHFLGATTTTITEDYLSEKFPMVLIKWLLTNEAWSVYLCLNISFIINNFGDKLIEN